MKRSRRKIITENTTYIIPHNISVDHSNSIMRWDLYSDVLMMVLCSKSWSHGAHSLAPVLLLKIFCFIKQVLFNVRHPPWSGMISQTGVCLCLACNKSWVDVSLLCSSLALIISGWWMAVTSVHYYNVTLGNYDRDVSTCLCTLLESVFFYNILQACSLFCTMQNRIFMFNFLRKSPVDESVKIVLKQLGCMLIRQSVQVTPASACGINSVHITTGCCMLLNRKEITFLSALETNSKHIICLFPTKTFTLKPI